MDEFREEREAMKHGTPKEKLEYFWLYYKWHVIITVVAIVAITSFIYTTVTKKETSLYALFLNSFVTAEDSGNSYKQGFLDMAGIDCDKYKIIVDTNLYFQPGAMDEDSYNALQKISIYVAAGEIDLFGADLTTFEYYAYTDYLTDLRDMLTPEQIEKYSPYFYYIDGKFLADKLEASENFNDSIDYNFTYPDPYKPEAMANPIPVGISLDNASEDFANNYVFPKTDSSVIGFVVTGQHLENAQAFIDYIFTTAK